MSASAATPSHPTTGLITLGGAMLFQPADPNDTSILSAMVTKKEDLAKCLDSAENEKLEVVHIIVQSKEMNRLYDPDAIGVMAQKMTPGAALTVHVLTTGEEHCAPVSPEDVAEIRSSLVLAGLMLEVEAEGAGGAWTLTARKR